MPDKTLEVFQNQLNFDDLNAISVSLQQVSNQFYLVKRSLEESLNSSKQKDEIAEVLVQQVVDTSETKSQYLSKKNFIFLSVQSAIFLVMLVVVSAWTVNHLSGQIDQMKHQQSSPSLRDK